MPEVAEGQYLLAARFSGEDGQPLATRSNVVFVTPEYPRLLEAARAALARARQKAATADALVRDVSLPSTEMLVEDAEMRWSDFGQAPRDWDFVKRQLETARRTPTASRRARTRGRAAPAPSRRRTAPRSTARSSRTRSTCRRPTTRRRPGR